MMFVEAQAKKRNVANGLYYDYGAPQTYQCGYGGYGSCKSTYTIFDWTYCAESGHYRTQVMPENFRPRQAPVEVETDARIGITKSAHLPWRFLLKGSPFLSVRHGRGKTTPPGAKKARP